MDSVHRLAASLGVGLGIGLTVGWTLAAHAQSRSQTSAVRRQITEAAEPAVAASAAAPAAPVAPAPQHTHAGETSAPKANAPPPMRCLQAVQEIVMYHADKLGHCTRGRVDHFAYDPAGKLIFVACLADDCVLVIDAFAGKCVQCIARSRLHTDRLSASQWCLNRPQGLLWVAQTSRLYVANAADGRVTVFHVAPSSTPYPSIRYITTLAFGDEADNLRYADGRVYVGYGEGAIGVIQDDTGNVGDAGPRTPHRVEGADIPLASGAHPEGFQLERGGGRIFVNVADRRQVAVLDRATRAVVATWTLPDGVGGNFPLCLDEDAGVVFVGARKPAGHACVLVLDIDSGEMLARVPVPRAGDMDDLHWDAGRQRLYVVGGTGHVSVVGSAPGRTRSGRRWRVLEDVPTSLGARTALWYPERDSLYVAAPETGTSPARLLVLQGRSD